MDGQLEIFRDGFDFQAFKRSILSPRSRSQTAKESNRTMLLPRG
jgi:hypothetical protein